jgi:hypothetical protein
MPLSHEIAGIAAFASPCDSPSPLPCSRLAARTRPRSLTMPAKYDPYGVQIALINRDRAELRAWATGRIGCYPKPPSKPKPKPPSTKPPSPSLFLRGIFCGGPADVEPWKVPGYPWTAPPLPCN